MILRKIKRLFRKKAAFQSHQRGERPAGSQASLIFHCRRSPHSPVIIRSGKDLFFRILGGKGKDGLFGIPVRLVAEGAGRRISRHEQLALPDCERSVQ